MLYNIWDTPFHHLFIQLSKQHHLSKSLSDYNSETLCPLKNTTNQIGLHRALEDIYKLQFKEDCFDPNNKFLIVNLTKSNCGTMGMGARMRCWVKYFEWSISVERAFLLTGEWAGAPKNYCANATYECFHLPLSNCEPNAVINHFGVSIPNHNICLEGSSTVCLVQRHSYAYKRPNHFASYREKYGLDKNYEVRSLLN